MKALLFSILLIGTSCAQVDALFKTTVGDFTVRLDSQNAPLATANFMLLAGIPDEVYGESDTISYPAAQVDYSPTRPGNIYRQLGRPALNVLYRQQVPNGPPPSYIIRQGGLVIGEVGGLQSGQTFQDVTGNNNISITQEIGTDNFSIRIRHYRNFLDSRFDAVREAPMFQNLRVTEVENGRRFFAGTMTFNAQESVGYRFPDEIAHNPSQIPPYGNRFSQGWVLAMDNRQANANGSRFFITGQPLPGEAQLMNEWNSRYTAFGTVLTTGGGRNVVNTILNSSPGPGTDPGAVITIRSIEVTQGPDAGSSFYPHTMQKHLPGPVSPLDLAIERTNDLVELVIPATPKSQRLFLTSTDLRSNGTAFFSSVPSSSFFPNRIDLGPTVANSPRSFFKAFRAQIPEWPSLEFPLSGARLSCYNVLSPSGYSGTVEITFNEASSQIPLGGSGTYRFTLPAQTVTRPDGTVTQFPQYNNFSGTFNSTYVADTDPFRGVLTFTSTSGEFPLEFINFNFDFRLGTLMENRTSRFSAGNFSTGYGIEGVWKKTN